MAETLTKELVNDNFDTYKDNLKIFLMEFIKDSTKGPKQDVIADTLGTDQERISGIFNLKTDLFSISILLDYCAKLGVFVSFTCDEDGNFNAIVEKGDFETDENHSHNICSLTKKINFEIKKRGLKQKAAGELLGIRQPRVSDLNKLKVTQFSLDSLIKYLYLLDFHLNFQSNKKTDKTPFTIQIKQSKSEI